MFFFYLNENIGMKKKISKIDFKRILTSMFL